ncbi:fatty acid synthase-like [Panonychus citri]|uniref:fatty acid synthase-like n=1 Tax=Panonychus citri TaxID=50023 RepID=UPI002306F0E3|nr:fatty acid synthase-like [Panonychus citri]
MSSSRKSKGINEITWKYDDTIVMSGTSGRFPEADSVEELWNNLMNSIPMYSKDSRRWPIKLINLPPNTGKIKDISKFDAEMFNIDPSLAHDMDPQMRLLHEVVYEALWDAGHDPNDLRGSRTGFFLGSCYDDTLAGYREDDSKLRPYHSFASRISYAYDWRGPVVLIDTACASSFSSFVEGLLSIKSGACDRCIIAGVAVQLRPAIANAFAQLKMLSPDGTSKCLDASADGYCRSEAVVALLLERESDAKRIYGKILNCRTNCDGYKQEGITFPGYETQYNLLKEVYEEIDVDPEDIDYVEAHITGTQAGDPVESAAIVGTLRPNNSTKPIMFGCLKSSIGHSEGASALCSLAKVSKIMQAGCIPPNLNYKSPNPNIKQLVDGIIKPVTQVTPFKDEYIAVNSFGFGGVNVHAVIQANSKNVNEESYNLTEPIDRLINSSNRTAEGLNLLFNFFETNRKEVNRGLLQIVNDTAKIKPEQGFKTRGYVILTADGIAKRVVKDVQQSRPLYFALGSTFVTELSKELIEFPVIQTSLQSSVSLLREKVNYDLETLLTTNNNEDSLGQSLKSLVIQLALIDLFKHLDLTPSGVFGVDYIGELVAAYSDEIINKNQALLSGYWLSNLSASTNQRTDQMTSILGSSVVGKANKLIQSNGLTEITVNYLIGRSSTTTTNESIESIMSKLPIDAAIVTPSNSFGLPLTSSQLVVPMIKSNSDGNTTHSLLSALGELYTTGQYPRIDRLYPSVSYPVPRETPHIGHLLRWDHSKTWKVCKYPEYFDFIQSNNNYSIEAMSPEWAFLEGHCIDGRVLVPATCYLYLAWHYLGRLNGIHGINVPVEFRNVRFIQATLLPKSAPVTFGVHINLQTNAFQVTDGDAIVVSGEIKIPSGAIPLYQSMMTTISSKLDTKDKISLKTKDIYKELRLRGYDYGPTFQGLVDALSDGSHGTVKFLDHWVSFSDALLQCAILAKKHRYLYLPTFIEYLRVDPTILFASIDEARTGSGGEACMDVYFDHQAKLGVTSGMILKGAKATSVSRRQNNQSVLLESYEFSPFNQSLQPNLKLEKKIGQYIEMCSNTLQQLTKPVENFDDSNIKKYLESTKGDEGALLQSLYQSLDSTEQTDSSPVQRLSKSLEANREQLSGDLLVSQSSINQLIQDQIGLVVENLPSKSIIITEINETFALLAETISDSISSLGIRAKVNLVHPEPESVTISASQARIIPGSIGSGHLPEIDTCDLIIYKDVRVQPLVQTSSCNQKAPVGQILSYCSNNLRNGGFALLCFRLNSYSIEDTISSLLDLPQVNLSIDQITEDEAASVGLQVISTTMGSSGQLQSILLRKPPQPTNYASLVVSTNDFKWVESLKTMLLSEIEQKVWLIADTNEPINGILGMVNCLRREPRGDQIRCLYNISQSDETNNLQSAQDLLSKRLIETDLVINVTQNGKLGSYRHHIIDPAETPMTQAKHIYLDVTQKGDLSSLRWHQSPHDIWNQMPPHLAKKGTELVNIYYSSLNFKDVMVATGRIPLDAYPEDMKQECIIGMEYAGICEESGKRVAGMCNVMGTASSVVTNRKESFMIEVPSSWTLEQAATVPVVYATVYYALFIRGNLRPGEKVLIHAGTGGVGQAAISVCLARGCEVFTTVGTQAKREFIKKMFPRLDDSHIGDSRSTSFEELIMKETNGYGVDIVLNSLSEDKFKASVRCLAEFGRFLEIGKYDIIQNNPLEETVLEGNRTYHGVCVAHLQQDSFVFKTQSGIQMNDTLYYMMARGIESGEVVPLSPVVFPMDQAEEAFRFMANGRHMGKVLIKMRDESEDARTSSRLFSCIARTYFSPEKSYIITGGLGGVGLELASWMVERGAMNLVLTSRSGPREPYQHFVLSKLRSDPDRSIVVSTNNGLTYASAAALIEEATDLAPVGGIFHLAMVLGDAIFENQSEETFEKVCGPKIKATRYLDSLSRATCPSLDYFVCFSSVASGKGNPGQTNYGFGNSFMERICEDRRASGHPGLAVQWGAIGDVGVVAENFGGNQVVLGGTVPQRIPSCLEVLDKFIQSGHMVTSSIVLADAKKVSGASKENLFRTVCHIIGVKDPGSLDPNVTLSELGLDSLMAVEIKQGLERDYDTILSTQEIRNLKVKEIQDLEERISKIKVNSNSSGGDKTSETPLFNLKPPESIFYNIVECTGVPIFVFPPIEGDFNLLIPILSELDRPVLGINWTRDLDQFETLEQIGAYYSAKIREKAPNQNGFDFIGYSFGGLVAFEVAIQLQQVMGKECIRQLILLDSAPDFLKAACSELVKRNQIVSEDEAHLDMLISFVSSLFAFENVNSFRATLLNLPTREERTKKINDLIESKTGITIDPSLLTYAANQYFRKMKMMYYYKTKRKLAGNVTVYKATEGYGKAFKEANEQELGLAEIVEGNVTIHHFSGDHRSFLSEHKREIFAKIQDALHIVVA